MILLQIKSIRILITIVIANTFFYSAIFSQSNYNYSEVLCKSLFFYEAQQSGELSPNNRVNWRANSAMDDGSDVGLDLTGGLYDAGDHVKFGFPMAYTATMLAWSGIEDETTYQNTAQLSILKETLKHLNDYFIKCHVRNADGTTNKFYGQLGNGSADHSWWGPAEVMQMARPAYYVDATAPGSDLTAETAAAMASASMLFANSDSAYSAQLLDNAIALYDFADTYRGKYSDAITDATAFYNSWSGYNDEIVWGAIWLYRATGDVTYLTKAQNEYNNLSNENGQNVKSYGWTLAWDDKSYGCYALMAQLTGQAVYKTDTERWLDFWTTGYNGQTISYSPGGQAHLDTWGSLRYCANTAFVALIYSNYISNSNATKAQVYENFAVDQINYILGDNPNNRSYVVGFGNNPPINPHHRTAHGSWADNIQIPTDNRHLLYGALVGGPSSANDQYVDDRSDFIANEVACDYNAGFTGAIAKIITLNNNATPQTSCYNLETFDSCEEYFFEAKINGSSNTYTEVSLWATNHSTWPATLIDDFCGKYFVDISEGIAAGYSASDYITTLNVSPTGSSVSGLQLLTGTTYFVDFCFGTEEIWPGGQSARHTETQLRIALPNTAPANAWDPTNDWSYFADANVPLDNALQTSFRIPFFNEGDLLCGTFPDGTSPNSNPVAVIQTNQTVGNAPLIINFDAINSFDADNDNLTYLWNFDDGTTTTNDNVSNVFSIPGSYNVTLTVNDGNGGTDTESIIIVVIDPTPQPPVASFAVSSTSGAYPLNVVFDATNSFDPNGDNLTYFWNFGDGTTTTGVNPTHTFTTEGVYIVTLAVADNLFSDYTTVTIEAINLPPVAVISASTTGGQIPLNVNVNASQSNDPNGENLTYNWDFGDGTTATGIVNNHTYTNAGNYIITLTVTDESGLSTTEIYNVNASLTGCNLVAYYKTNNNSINDANDNAVRPNFIIENIGTDIVNLADVKIRYWYLKEGTTSEQAWVDYASVGAANITTSFTAMSSPTIEADNYFEVGFLSAAGMLDPGENTGDIQTRFSKTDWSSYDEINDYSFDLNKNTYEIHDKITLYCNNNLAFGIEPTSCVASLNISTLPINNNTYQVSQQINSTAFVNFGKAIVYKAGSFISLNNNFEVEQGATFIAEIDGCQ